LKKIKLQNTLLREDRQDYIDLGIVCYGSFLYATTKLSSLQRLRVFGKISMRSIITPQYFELSHVKLALAIRGYAIDNGAWLCHKKNEKFPTYKFLQICEELGSGADWVALPDVVGDGLQTLKKIDFWHRKVKEKTDCPQLIVWQDGMTKEDIEDFLKDGLGVFVGGTTEGKLKNFSWISELCKKHNVWCHMGRVNTMKRIKLAYSAGVDSFDGSGFSQFPHMTQYVYNMMTANKQQLRFFRSKLPFISKDKNWIKYRNERLKGMNYTIKDLEDFYTTTLGIDTSYIGLPKGFPREQFKILINSGRS